MELTEGSTNVERAVAAVSHTVSRLGVREVVVCAGARNTPILVAAARHPLVRCWRHFDERSAGFFALGRIKATKRPVAVVVTSGTAVAELLPSVIEGFYAGEPLVVIAGDRQAEWRGGGAPQSIEQAGIFGGYALCADLRGEANDGALLDDVCLRWEENRTSPVFFNLCFSEPLFDGGIAVDFGELGDEVITRDEPCFALSADDFAPRTGVVVGQIDESDRRDVASALANLGLPVWAEVTSGLAVFPELAELLIPDWATFLHDDELKPDQLVRLGGVPNGRFWRDLESLPEVRVTSVSEVGMRGLGREQNVVIERRDVEDWVNAWSKCGYRGDGDWIAAVLAKAAAEREVIRECVAEFSTSEVGLMAKLLKAASEADVAFFGNSLSIREAQLVAGNELAGRIHASRGANGIDGQLSTFIGSAVGAAEAWGVFGDLTTLYDFSAPWMLDQVDAATAWRFVVINNGGGKIFSRLPYLEALSDAEDALLVNDTSNVDFGDWARLWKMQHVVVKVPEDFDQIDATDSRVLVEIRPDAAASEAFWRTLRKSRLSMGGEPRMDTNAH